MEGKVKNYLEKAKKRDLLKRGLYDVKYHNDNEAINMQSEDNQIIYHNGRYIEFIPYELSDEEYNEILKYNYYDTNQPEYDVILESTIYSHPFNYSSMPTILSIFAYIFIIAEFFDIYKYINALRINQFTTVKISFNSFVIALILFALSKVIILLEQIRNK